MSDGSREIAAAKQRVAAARNAQADAAKRVDSATAMAKEAKQLSNNAKSMAETAKNMAETAKRNKDTAKTMAEMAETNKERASSQLQNTSRELKEAEAFLRESEKKWEVIDVDTPEKVEKPKPKKRRKVGPNNAEVPANQQNNVIGGASASSSAEPTSNDIPDIIEVSGCGMLEMNGLYKKGDIWGGYEDGRYHCFKRSGVYNAKASEFTIFHNDGHWYIGCSPKNGGSLRRFYRTTRRFDFELPPSKGWMAYSYGISPAPELKW